MLPCHAYNFWLYAHTGECDAGKVQGIGVFGAAYMTVVTASTVGYGDLTPQSSIGKLIGILYFPAAVALMSKTILAVSMIPSEYRQLKLEEYVLDQFGEQLTVADLEDLRQSVNITSADEGCAFLNSVATRLHVDCPTSRHSRIVVLLEAEVLFCALSAVYARTISRLRC